jgi:hypothetical protein
MRGADVGGAVPDDGPVPEPRNNAELDLPDGIPVFGEGVEIREDDAGGLEGRHHVN